MNYADYVIMDMIKLGSAMLVFTIVVWLIMREVWCWYLKINKGIRLLAEIRDLLAEQKGFQNAGTESGYSGLSSKNHRNLNVKIDRDVEPGTRFEAEINPYNTPGASSTKSRWDIDKPMQPSGNKQWQPPKNK